MKKRIIVVAIVLVLIFLAYIGLKKFISFGSGLFWPSFSPITFALTDKLEFSTKTPEGNFKAIVNIIDKYRFMVTVKADYPVEKDRLIDSTNNEVISSTETPGGATEYGWGTGGTFGPKYILQLMIKKDGKEKWIDLPLFKKQGK